MPETYEFPIKLCGSLGLKIRVPLVKVSILFFVSVWVEMFAKLEDTTSSQILFV
jgi:hypothetical protein